MTSGATPAASDVLSLEPVHAELRQRSIRSGLIAAAGRVAQGIISLGAVAVLARLLTPAEFGVIAMVMPITTVASMTMHRGLHFGLLHAEQLDTRQVSRMYWIALRYNVLLVAGVALLGPVLAVLYGEPRVRIVAAIWAASLLVLSLGAFHEALLRRQLRIGSLTLVNVGGLLAGTVAAISAARWGAGYMALLLQFVVWDAVRCSGAILLCRWRPDRRDWAGGTDPAVSRLASFGTHFTMHRAVYWAGRQADRIVVGAVAGAAPLGLYDGARRWSWYAFHELFQSMTEVMVASLSRARANVDRFREFCRNGFMAFLIPPLAVIAFVFAEAEAVVRLLLGERWIEAIPLVRIMCAAAFCDALSRLTMWLYTAEGRTRQQFHWSLLMTPVMLAAIGFGAPRGVHGIAVSFATATALLMIPTVAFCLRGSAIRARDFVALAWRPVTSSLSAGMLLVMLRPRMPDPTHPAGFTVALLGYVMAYAAIWFALPGGQQAARTMRDAVVHAFPTRA